MIPYISKVVAKPLNPALIQHSNITIDSLYFFPGVGIDYHFLIELECSN